MPTLADEVLKNKNELKIIKDKREELEAELEDPKNKNRFRELKGFNDEPDEEALEAKI